MTREEATRILDREFVRAFNEAWLHVSLPDKPYALPTIRAIAQRLGMQETKR
jgi:hypothetical protein